MLLISAESGITEQDTKIAGLAHNAGKAVIIVVNKWDLVENKSKRRRYFASNSHPPAIYGLCTDHFMSVKTGLRVDELLNQIKAAYDMACCAFRRVF